VDLALAIFFLWLGAALLFVAFHPLQVESGTGPATILKDLQSYLNAGQLGAAAGSEGDLAEQLLEQLAHGPAGGAK
jgi:hypothetical protein